ncbi:hypothetical protein [Candidatus Methylacidiphilum infernorum]|nr:hypothetical protein [Candidatus Methylacidiphilum infernorum]
MHNREKNNSLSFQLFKFLFFLYVSWFFPCELLTVRKMGKDYANPKRFLVSLTLLLILSWINKTADHKNIGIMLIFCGLLSLIYLFEALVLYYEEEKKKILRNPLSWGIPRFGFPGNEWFWYLFQPLMILLFSLLSSLFCPTLFFYFLVSAVFLWIFRFLSFRFYKEAETEPPWTDDFPSEEEEEEEVMPGSTEIIQGTEGSTPLKLRKLNPQFVSLAIIGLLASCSLIFYEKAFFFSRIPLQDSLARVLAREEEKLSSSMPEGWTFKTALSKEEDYFTLSHLQEKYHAQPPSFLQQLWTYWKEQKAEVVSGRFYPKAIKPLWAPFAGIMIQWVPVEEKQDQGPDTELWTYLETPSSLYNKLSPLFPAQAAPVVTFGKELKAYLFDVTPVGAKTVFHAVIPFSFTLNIAGCPVSQTLPDYYAQNEYQLQGQKIKALIIQRQRELLAELKTAPLTKEKLEEIKKEAALLKTKLAEIEGKR